MEGMGREWGAKPRIIKLHAYRIEHKIISWAEQLKFSSLPQKDPKTTIEKTTSNQERVVLHLTGKGDPSSQRVMGKSQVRWTDS